MKAVRYGRRGGIGALEIVEAPEPEAASGEAVVKVAAAGVNPLDWKLLQGHYRLVFPTHLPHVPGLEISGTVVGLGPGCSRLQRGDEVIATIPPGRGGGFAEFAAVREADCVGKPRSLSHREASCLLVGGLSALQSLRNLGRLSTGGRVLVLGASGGVGHLAVQIATLLGGEVTAVCSGKNREMVQSLGAEEVIDYTEEDFRDCGEVFDVVLDAVARHSFWDCRRLIRPGGSFVSTLPGPSALLASLLAPLFHGRHCRALILRPSLVDMEWLVDQAAGDRLEPIIQETYHLDQAGKALARSAEGHVAGKLVIAVDPSE